MMPIDGQVMFEIAPRFSGSKAKRQAEIIAEIGPVLASTLASYGIDTRLRIAHFLGQTCMSLQAFVRRRSLPAARHMRDARTSATSRKATARCSRDAACSNSPAEQTTATSARF